MPSVLLQRIYSPADLAGRAVMFGIWEQHWSVPAQWLGWNELSTQGRCWLYLWTNFSACSCARYGNAEIAGVDIGGLDIDGRLRRGGHCRTGQLRTGYWRTGQWRTGHCRTGHCRTGQWRTNVWVGNRTVIAKCHYLRRFSLRVFVWNIGLAIACSMLLFI